MHWYRLLLVWECFLFCQNTMQAFVAGNSLLLQIFFIYSTYVKPRALNMPAIQRWLQSALGAKDFMHLMFSVLLVTSQLHFKIAPLSVFCWALDHVARCLRRIFAHSFFYRC